jgi:hypothetical protein
VKDAVKKLENGEKDVGWRGKDDPELYAKKGVWDAAQSSSRYALPGLAGR